MSAPHRRPAAVIFDMDGLMLDTETLAALAWGDAAGLHGLPFDMAVTPRMVGRTFTDCRAIIAEHHGPDYPVDRLMGAWHAAYERRVESDGLVVKPGVVELLAWLEIEGVPRAVATSTRRESAAAKLTRTSLLPRFMALVGGDEIARGKPAPDIFLEAAARIGCVAEECLVLEDSIAGYLGARAAGMAAIVVPDGVAPPASAYGDLPPTRMTTLHEVHSYLARLPSVR